MVDEELMATALAYAVRHGLELAEPLGDGIHGIVLMVGSQAFPGRTALKVHRDEAAFQREVKIYERLRDKGISDVGGFHVPQLVRVDADLLALEMTIVSPPFVLDFAGDYLDAMPEFPEEVWEDWAADKEEQFGERWPKVQSLLSALRAHGVFMLDPSPNNVRFE